MKTHEKAYQIVPYLSFLFICIEGCNAVPSWLNVNDGVHSLHMERIVDESRNHNKPAFESWAMFSESTLMYIVDSKVYIASLSTVTVPQFKCFDLKYATIPLIVKSDNIMAVVLNGTFNDNIFRALLNMPLYRDALSLKLPNDELQGSGSESFIGYIQGIGVIKGTLSNIRKPVAVKLGG